MMKKMIINITLAVIAITTVLTSCSDFLEVEQKGKATIPSFLSDPSGLHAGLVGAYNKLFAYYDNEFTKYPDVAGNMASMLVTSSGSDMINQYNFTSDPSQETSAVGHIWQKIYVAQANVNNVIQYEPDVEAAYPAQASSCKNYLGQALLLRALCEFDQCRVYAQPYNYTSDASHLGVPILNVTPGPDDNVARASVKEVYDFILSDLTTASGLLTDQVASNFRYASLQAVNAMFSRVYLYMENWEQALYYAKLAIGTQKLAQGQTYLNMYDDLSTQGEAIFRLSGQDMGGYLKTFYQSACVPADTLISLFDKDDIRRQFIDRNDSAVCRKYYASKVPDNQPKRDDPFIFRLSEEYLNAAEAAWNIGSYNEARTYIGAIVERAVGTERAALLLAQYTDPNLIRLIRTERVKELCFEGHNFFDITRWKQNLVRERKTNSVVQRIAYPSDLFVLPIPQSELNANANMVGNPTVNK